MTTKNKKRNVIAIKRKSSNASKQHRSPPGETNTNLLYTRKGPENKQTKQNKTTKQAARRDDRQKLNASLSFVDCCLFIFAPRVDSRIVKSHVTARYFTHVTGIIFHGVLMYILSVYRVVMRCWAAKVLG